MSFTKDPNAELDYTRDWSDWLAAVDDTIQTSTWIVPEGIEVGEGGETFTDTTTTIWLAGGTVLERYALTNRITTAGGRTDDRTFYVVIKER